jgi:hypothetical protein
MKTHCTASLVYTFHAKIATLPGAAHAAKIRVRLETSQTLEKILFFD